jgi:hypothetical protein
MIWIMKKEIKRKFFVFDEPAILYSLAVLVFLVGFSLIFWFGYQYFFHRSFPTALVALENQAKTGACNYERRLDGVCVEMESQVNPKVVAVMIDNHMDARPPAGLSQAAVVYEAPVEANFTRFMAIYPSDQEIVKVGPVRSARPYFLDWLSEYGSALYMHCGGSPEALQKIKDYGINDFNEFYRGWYYWRDNSRSAPHNIFTSSELWNKALTDYADNYGTESYETWQFGEVKKCEINCTTRVAINFSSTAFEAVWKFNSSTEKYERYQAGRLHKDQDGTIITADTLIIQKANSTVLDGVGRLAIDTVGTGEAIVFANGNIIQGEWKKESRTGRTRWLDSTGEEIVLKAGKIWVEVVNVTASVEY